MAISIDWGTKVISIPQADLSFVGGSVYNLDTDWFRLQLKDLEDDADGIVFPKTHNHNTQVLLGGISYARIVEIINGYTITFEETGSPYVVNLVGSNNNILDVTNLGTVQIRSNNSAGLINVTELQHGIFGDQVTIDVTNGVAGTIYPAGTPLQPVNNIVDAVTIAQRRGFFRLYIRGNITLGAGDVLADYTILGQSIELTNITVDPAAEVLDCLFMNAHIEGTLDGSCVLLGCEVNNLTFFSGEMRRCGIYGTVTLGNNAQAEFIDCHSGIAGGATPVIDMGGTGQSLIMRSYDGGIQLENKTGTDGCSLDMNSGQVKINLNTCTAGEIVIRGNATVYSTAGDEVILTHGYYGSLYVDNYATTGLMVQETWQRLGLDKSNPVTNKSDGGFAAGDITVVGSQSGTDIIQTRS